MSIYLTALVWDAKLTPLQKIAMLALASTANDQGYILGMNIEKLSFFIGISIDDTGYVLQRLEEKGLFSIHNSVWMIHPEEIKEISK